MGSCKPKVPEKSAKIAQPLPILAPQLQNQKINKDINSQNLQDNNRQVTGKRKSQLGSLLGDSKLTINNRFTRPEKQHIQIITEEEKMKQPIPAQRINFEDHLETVREYLKVNGQDVTNCSICLLDYNFTTREPMMICMNQHTICLSCVHELENKNICKCPFDKETFEVKKVRRNRMVIGMMQQSNESQKNRFE